MKKIMFNDKYGLTAAVLRGVKTQTRRVCSIKLIKMKASDLMVGDFVVYTEFGKNDIDKIETLEPRRVWLEHGKTYVPIEYIEPIPLTKEILEKNGFKFGLYGECFFSTLSTSTITLFKFHGDIWWYHGIKIEKVHELQHVLRLCGIKKEIKL